MTLSVSITLPWRDRVPEYVSAGRFVDPWLAVCDRCPLPDCVRLEGDLQTGRSGTRYPSCPVWSAQVERGWDANEALANAAELGLKEEVTWLEY